MFAAGGKCKAGVLMAGLLAVTCAVAAPTASDRLAVEARVLAASGGARLQSSRLVSRRDLPFRTVRRAEARGEKTLLVHDSASAGPLPVAWLIVSTAQPRKLVALQRLPVPASASEVELATLEHLYSLVLAEEPEAAFCLAAVGRSCDASRRRSSQAEVLADIAATRRRMLVQRKLPDPVSWRGVSLVAARTRGEEDEVRVVVKDARGPLPGGSVAFHKAPHFGCLARSGPDGVASCRLVDLHPEEHSHDEHGEAPVIATFSGDVRGDHVLLPTTMVMRFHGSHGVGGAHRK